MAQPLRSKAPDGEMSPHDVAEVLRGLGWEEVRVGFTDALYDPIMTPVYGSGRRAVVQVWVVVGCQGPMFTSYENGGRTSVLTLHGCPALTPMEARRELERRGSTPIPGVPEDFMA